MEEIKTESIFESFFKYRDSLIIQYEKGEITKRQFLQENFDSVQRMNIEPFAYVNSYEKGMYNYQYYNVLAKYYNMLAGEIKEDYKLVRKYNEYREKTNQYYAKKDQSTLQLLKFLKFENMEAYFIKVESRYLNNKLYEIVLKDYEYAIFHSKSRWLLRVLREERVFIERKRKSKIDEYINEKY